MMQFFTKNNKKNEVFRNGFRENDRVFIENLKDSATVLEVPKFGSQLVMLDKYPGTPLKLNPNDLKRIV